MTLEQVFEALLAAPAAPELTRESREIAEAIDHRRRDEVHDCAFAHAEPVRARTALYYHRSDLFGRPAWIDACPRHYSELHALAMTWPSDGVVVAAFEAWMESR